MEKKKGIWRGEILKIPPKKPERVWESPRAQLYISFHFITSKLSSLYILVYRPQHTFLFLISTLSLYSLSLYQLSNPKPKLILEVSLPFNSIFSPFFASPVAFLCINWLVLSDLVQMKGGKSKADSKRGEGRWVCFFLFLRLYIALSW